MAAPAKAVFLSYSSQDADAALRIRDALMAKGLEVWFDKDELRGGDAWDASIRKQIKDCALFVPVISANTEERAEGYFRLEWKLAVDRSHQMADDRAFLVPVALDETPEATARVPDRFRELQWSRLAGAERAEAFAVRVAKLLGQAAPVTAARSARADAPANDTPSIAVLPFVNMSRDEENEYFADGLSEELLNVLAKIRGLRVASRTSAFYFKGKDVDLPTVARKLNVATILEGSVRKSGKRVRITAQLIEVATDSHLWSETYDRELDDIFTVQDDIAQSVVAELRPALMGQWKAAAAGRAVNPEAHRLYLQGRFYAERMTQADLARAVELYGQALALEPGFALAWALLARAYGVQAGYGWAPVAEGYERSREAAMKAIALEPELAEGHANLGVVRHIYDRDWKGAEAELKRASELAPGNVDVMRSYAALLSQTGRQDESYEMLRRAVALDPLSFTSHRLLGLRCAIYRRYDEAEPALRTAIDLNPTAGLAHCFLAIVRMQQGHREEALEIARREVLPSFRIFGIATTEHALGHAAEADAALTTLIEKHGATMAFQIAELHAFRGEPDSAFEWLERALAQRDPGLVHCATDFLFEPLHGDARWPVFLKKAGFG